MSEAKLYPLHLCSLEDKYIWGKEEFRLADLGYRDSLIKDGWLASNSLSEVMDTYMDRMVGDFSFNVYGRQFPIQVKHIFCEGKMPLRVHPDDSIAETRYDALGKEKLWYILSADAQSRLVLGFNKNIDATRLIDGLQDGSIEEDLLKISVKPGSAYRIPPGLVHGAIGNVEILEISESSALDFCIYPWGAPLGEDEFDSALGIIDALDFIDYKKSEPAAVKAKKLNDHVDELLNISQFIVNKIDLKDTLKISSEKSDTFSVYYCLYGKAQITAEVPDIGEVHYPLEKDSLVLVPAEVAEVTLSPLEKTTAIIEALGQVTVPAEE